METIFNLTDKSVDLLISSVRLTDAQFFYMRHLVQNIKTECIALYPNTAKQLEEKFSNSDISSGLLGLKPSEATFPLAKSARHLLTPNMVLPIAPFIKEQQTWIDKRGLTKKVPMKLLCFGLSRTGTSSLRVALRELGLEAYHA